MIAMLLFSATVKAQGTPEYQLYAGTGLSTLNYQPEAGTRSFFGLGVMAGFEFNYLFTRQWGMGVGVELMTYAANTTADAETYSYTAWDKDGTPFVFNTEISYFEEKQRAVIVNVPLTVNFRFGKSLNKFYLSMGVKVGVYPLIGRSSHEGADLFTSGDYDPPRSLTTAEKKELGFGEYEAPEQSFDLNLRTGVSATIEFGKRWRFNKNQRLYTGLYADYGLTNIQAQQTIANLVEYDHTDPQDYTVNSVVALSNKIGTLSAGIVLRFAFGPNETRGHAVRSPNHFARQRRDSRDGVNRAPLAAPTKEPKPAHKLKYKRK